MDLTNPRWMHLKAALFILIGLTCFALLLLEHPTLTTATYLLLMSWAFCRAYYFAFYVIEHYVDHQYKFSGLISFLQYLLRKRRRDQQDQRPGVIAAQGQAKRRPGDG